MKNVALILNYNNYKDTIECVKNLKLQNSLGGIIVVDNASTNDSISVIRRSLKDISNLHIIESEQNNGYAAGNNIGLRYAIDTLNAQNILVCNPDVRILDDNVVELLSCKLDSSEQITSVAPRMLDADGKKDNNAWKVPTFVDDLILSSYILIKLLKNRTNYLKCELDSGNELEVEVLSGSCFMIKGSYIKSINYLDEGTFLYCEERILGRKVKDDGLVQVLMNDIYFYHFHSTTISSNISSNIKRNRILNESRMYYQIRYNKIGLFKKTVLMLFQGIGLAENICIRIVRKMS